jgi:hypothetical protein
MPQSLSKVLGHLIYSTKHREPLIPEPIRPRLRTSIVGILGSPTTFSTLSWPLALATVTAHPLAEQSEHESSEVGHELPPIAWSMAKGSPLFRGLL